MRLQLTDRCVDLDSGQITGPGSQVATLTALERKALAYLAAHAQREVPYEQLLTEVWGYARSVSSRAPYFAMRRLRAKLEVDPKRPQHLLTVYGVGFCFVPVRAAGSPDDPSPVRRITNLVPETGRLRGRDHTLRELEEAVRTHRLATVAGPAGVGKTSLARQLGRQLVDGGTPVWFVDLTNVHDESGLRVAMAGVLGVPLGPPDRAAQTLAAMLAAHAPCLFVLDNFEQLIPHGLSTLATWWRDGAPARFLVTSRRRLRMHDERVIELKPLESGPAVAMLRDRAAAVGRSLPDTPATDAALETLATSVDYLPLGLTLAASRLTVLSPHQISSRLAASLDVLSNGPRDVGRHRSLRATLESSWTRLSHREQGVLAALSVFRGGFWMEDVEAVVEGEPGGLLDTMQDLVERSLVRATDVAEAVGDVRFSMLLTVRTFAGEALAASESSAQVEYRHARHYAALWDQLRLHPYSVSAIGLEADNLRASMARAPDVATACRAALALDRVLADTVSVEEQREHCERALAMARTTTHPALLADALIEWSRTLRGTSQKPDDALCEARDLVADDPIRLAEAWYTLGNDRLGRGEVGLARAPLAQAEALVRGCDAPELLHRVLQARLHRCLDAGSFQDGQAIAQQLEQLREHPRLAPLPYDRLANWYLVWREPSVVVAAAKHDLAMFRRQRKRNLEAVTLGILAYAAMDQGEPEAVALFREAIEIAHQIGSLRVEAQARHLFAVCLLDRNDHHESRVQCDQCLAGAIEMDNPRLEAHVRALMVNLDLHAGSVEGALAHARAGLAAARTAGDEFGEAYLDLHLGVTLCALGDAEHGRAAFARGEQWFGSSPNASASIAPMALFRALVLASGDADERARASATGCPEGASAEARILARTRDVLLRRAGSG